MTSGANTIPTVRSRPAWLPLVFGAFGLLGFMFGGWVVVLPDLKLALALSDGALGTALSLGALGSLPAMWLGGRAADRFGPRLLLLAGGLALAGAIAIVAVLPAPILLVPVLWLYSAGFGTFDVGINTAAIRLEQTTGRRLLPYAHAMFSGGSALGALSAGLLLAAQVPFRLVYIGLAVLVAGYALFAWTRRVGAPQPAPMLPQAAGQPAGVSLFRMGALWPVALLAMATALGEHILETWTSIYLRTYLALPVVLGASGVVVFHAAMLTGRVAAGRLLGRVRRRTYVGWAGLVIVLGMSLALATTQAPLILAGFMLVGLALAGLIPTAFSLAGDLAPDRAGQATAAVTLVGYSGALLGPVLIGRLADAFGLRAALGVLILAGAAVALLSRFLKARQ